MESGIKEYLLSYMKSTGLINNSQHGFMASKSTTTHLLECCFDWNVALRSRRAVDVIYLDFAKAFDSVVHSKLLAKSASYGISNMVLKWIESFLVGRSQCVSIAGSSSIFCPVISGVPPGSVLGPILFIDGKNPGFLQGCKSQCSHTSKTANIKSSYAPHTRLTYSKGL
jgi:hypothetical protein